jgi:hypothetical protein
VVSIDTAKLLVQVPQSIVRLPAPRYDGSSSLGHNLAAFARRIRALSTGPRVLGLFFCLRIPSARLQSIQEVRLSRLLHQLPIILRNYDLKEAFHVLVQPVHVFHVIAILLALLLPRHGEPCAAALRLIGF